MKMAIPFLGGGSRNLGGGSASFKLLTTKDSKKQMIYYAVFLFRDPPFPEFLDPPLGLWFFLYFQDTSCIIILGVLLYCPITIVHAVDSRLSEPLIIRTTKFIAFVACIK